METSRYEQTTTTPDVDDGQHSSADAHGLADRGVAVEAGGAHGVARLVVAPAALRRRSVRHLPRLVEGCRHLLMAEDRHALPRAPAPRRRLQA